MLISQVELPVSDTVQAARFYGDVLALPTRHGWRCRAGRGWACQCCCSIPARWSRARITAPLPSLKTALLEAKALAAGARFTAGAGRFG